MTDINHGLPQSKVMHVTIHPVLLLHQAQLHPRQCRNHSYRKVSSWTHHWHWNLFNWPGQSRITFWGGTARNV